MGSFACALLLLGTAHLAIGADARVVTNGSSVRLRSAPGVTASIAVELPLGAELTVLERSNLGDPWLRVRTDDGLEGWILGRLATPLDLDHYDWTVEPIVLAQLKNHQATPGTSFRARVQLFDLIERTLKRVIDREIIARFALYRLRSMRDVLLGVPFGADKRAPYQGWITAHYDDAQYDSPSGSWSVNHDYVLKVHEEYRETSIADDIAWFGVENGLIGECEGRLPCYIGVLKILQGEYLQMHPRGRHADESTAEITKRLDDILADFQSPDPLELIELKAQCDELHLFLDPLKAAVAQSTSARRTDALTRIDRLTRLCS